MLLKSTYLIATLVLAVSSWAQQRPSPATPAAQMQADRALHHYRFLIGKSPDGCGITSYKATPFGTNAIALEWTEGSCRSGQMILARKS
jgi:hypothetical protein